MEELIAFQPYYVGYMQQFDATPLAAGYAVNWYESVLFCRWLGKQAGISEEDQCYADPESLDKETNPRDPDPDASWALHNWPLDLERRGFRLPTESEWEVASRAGMRTAYGYGGEEGLLARFGWFTANSGKHAHAPRELRPTVRGIFDLHGNLVEWTQDWLTDYDVEPVTDPLVVNGGSLRVNRGGGWSNEAAVCRAAFRNTYVPSIRSNVGGFRLALSPSGVISPAKQVQAE